jgi:hypothetical protein
MLSQLNPGQIFISRFSEINFNNVSTFVLRCLKWSVPFLTIFQFTSSMLLVHHIFLDLRTQTLLVKNANYAISVPLVMTCLLDLDVLSTFIYLML